jgi:hypothetical protein
MRVDVCYSLRLRKTHNEKARDLRRDAQVLIHFFFVNKQNRNAQTRE